MLSRRRNALPKSFPTPRAPLPQHTLEFGTITNSQHLNSRSLFLPGRHWALRQRFTSLVGGQFLCWPRITSYSFCVACQNWHQPHSSGDREAKKCRIPARAEKTHYAHSLFNTSAPPLDLSEVHVPANPDSYHFSRQSKATRRSATAPSTKQMQMVSSARVIDRTILKVTMIPRLRFGCVLTLQSKPHLHNLSTNWQSVHCPSVTVQPLRIWLQNLAGNEIWSCTANTSTLYLLRFQMQTLKLICSYTPLLLASMKSNSF